jgi:hypothetical protein
MSIKIDDLLFDYLKIYEKHPTDHFAVKIADRLVELKKEIEFR